MSEPEYLTVTQAAARLGISERTLRKRIKAGEVEAEKRPLEGGGTAWQVLLSPDRIGSGTETESEANRKVSETRAGSEPEARRKFLESESLSERKRTGSEPEVSEPISEPRAGSGTESTLLAHLQTENAFLRGLVEQRDRDAAELRAALREALKAMPKAIEAPAGTAPENLTKPDTQKSPSDALQAPQTGQPAQSTGRAANAPQRGAKQHKSAAWQRVIMRVLGVRLEQ